MDKKIVVKLFVLSFLVGILYGFVFPIKTDKTKVNVEVDIEKKEEEVIIPKNDIWKDIEIFMGKEAVDL